MSDGARRWVAFLLVWCATLLGARAAGAAQPLRPQVARCIPTLPVPADAATKGAGNVSSTRKVAVEFRWALGNALENANDEIQATNRVEICWTSAAKAGIAQCPGQTGDDGWIIYRETPLKGALPQAVQVQNPTQSLGAPGVSFNTPLDWDSLADRNKILFIVVNQTVQDGANLLTAQNANLTAGGLCGTPTRIEPGSPGTTTAAAEHFVVYGTPADFPLPAQWLTRYPGVCDPDSIAACPGNTCWYTQHSSLGPCIERASVKFWRGMMDDASDWNQFQVQAGVTALIPWTNGSAASGSTCTTGQPCPTRSMWVSYHGAGTGGDGLGVNWLNGAIFDKDPVIPLSKDAGYVLRSIGHEYFHTFGAKWAKLATDASGYDASNVLFNDFLVNENFPELAGVTMCFTGYPGNPNGDKVPAGKPCVSAQTLYGYDSWAKVIDKYLEFPGGNENYLAPYVGFWFYRYAAEQFAIPKLKSAKAHPSGVDSVLPVGYDAGGKPANLAVRRADEGIDLVGYLYRSLDPSQSGDPCAFPNSPPAKHSAKARLSCALQAALGRSFDDVLFDFHTMLVLKDYVVSDYRWTPEWLGDFNAGAAAPLWKADPAHGVPAAPAPKAPLRTLRPYVAANGAGYPKNALDTMPDGLHRAYRVLDTYSCADAACNTKNVNRLQPGATLAAPHEQQLGSYRAAFLSISPDPGWAGAELEVWVEKKKGKPRVRVFTVDTSGVATLHAQCTSPTAGVADECSTSAANLGKVRVPVKVTATTQEILLVVSGGSDPSSFRWQFGPEESELTIVSPTAGKPALIGAPAPFGDERAFVLMFTARDGAGKPYDIVTSANLDILVGGTSIAGNCPTSSQNPGPCPFTLLGMSGGSYMAVVQVPPDLYFPTPWPKTLDLEIRLKNGTASQADLEPGALRVDTARENVNTVFVLDTSGSMGSSGKWKRSSTCAALRSPSPDQKPHGTTHLSPSFAAIKMPRFDAIISTPVRTRTPPAPESAVRAPPVAERRQGCYRGSNHETRDEGEYLHSAGPFGGDHQARQAALWRKHLCRHCRDWRRRETSGCDGPLLRKIPRCSADRRGARACGRGTVRRRATISQAAEANIVVATGLTFDTGMLIALERRRRRAEEFLLRAREQRIVPVVPADVVVEWWRGRTDRREAILALVNVEPLSHKLACIAGEALAAVRSATAIDAIVMASAASRGDVVLTSDPRDLERLRSYFPSVRLLAV